MPKNITEPQILQDPHNGKERPWRAKKVRSLKLSDSFRRMGERNRAARVLFCGSQLTFAVNTETGEKRLHSANFCRERLCPMCGWRRSIKCFHEVSRVMDKTQADRPELVPLFLTLTLRNVPGDKLSETLDTIFNGWKRLGMAGTRFRRIVPGWFRALEVTYSAKSDTFHPHIHAILMVDKGYFKGKDYMETCGWVQLWRKALRLDYDPVCDIRRIRGGRRKSLKEVSKYTVKDTDYISDDKELTDKLVGTLGKALKGRRLYAYGGILKQIAKELNAAQPDNGDETIRNDVGEMVVTYRWNMGLANYYRE
jgi:plasmid rolling circle replication initiator protein Rep